MLAAVMLMVAAMAPADPPPVPGLCSAPVPADSETAGCYLTGKIDLPDAPRTLSWHVVEYPSAAAAAKEAGQHRRAAVAEAHGRHWLYVLGDPEEAINGGIPRAVIGPLHLPAGPATAHFSESIFPPGMQTRVHAHPGPEAFYVVEGEQCMETPDDRRIVPAGGTYIVERGVHVQAAPGGRRNLVLIVAPQGQAAVIPGGAWRPTGFCR